MNQSSWHDINEPGAFVKKGGGTQQAAADETPEQAAADDAPEVRLADPVFVEGDEGYKFNKKCFAQVNVEYLKETPRKKVTFDLFCVCDGQEENLNCTATADEEGGVAKAEITLYYGDAYGKKLDADPAATCTYIFRASHSTGEKVVESEPLEMPQSDKISVDFVEIADVHFHHNCALPCLDEKGDLIAALVSAFTYAKEHADRELVIEGHADRSGDANYNLQISKRRAEAIKALLEKDGDQWSGIVKSDGKDQKIETEDYQQTLKSLAVKYGWPCDPGAVDNKKGTKTEAAVKSFQSEYNKRFSPNEQLTVDGSVGPKTWQAIFFTLRDLLDKALKSAKLDPPPTLTYGYPDGDGIYPCGERCPVTDLERSEKDRRVELVFYAKDDWSPAIPPSPGRTGDPKKDPVSGRDWGKTVIVPKTIPTPVEKPVQIKGKLFWSRTWDYLDETKPIAAIKEYLPGAKVALELKKKGDPDFKLHAEVYLSDGVEKVLPVPHANTGEFVFDNVPKSDAARLKILLEYKDGKIVCVKGKTIKGNTKFKDEPDFKIHTGKTVEHTRALPIDTVIWTQEKNDVGDLEITKALFVDICDSYKSVWVGCKRIKELAEYDAPLCQINFPEDPAITVSNAGEQMQLCQDDLKDRAVILHEYGHFLGTKILGGLVHPGYGYNDDLTNSHSPTSKEHYEAAWNEGHATFLSCALTDNPHYHDGYDTTLDMHLDTDDTKVGPHCEGSIQDALWRIYKTHKVGFKDGFWKAFSDRSKRTCRTIFDLFDNWKDLKLASLDRVIESYKHFNLEHGYMYLDGAERFTAVAAPKVYAEAKKEFATLVELHTHNGSIGGGTKADYNEEFYNRNKAFNAGSLGAGSSIAAPKTKVNFTYIVPERFAISA